MAIDFSTIKAITHNNKSVKINILRVYFKFIFWEDIMKNSNIRSGNDCVLY